MNKKDLAERYLKNINKNVHLNLFHTLISSTSDVSEAVAVNFVAL